MDSLDLFAGLEAVASSGLVLSVDNRASLQSSLVLLKAAEKFAQVKFWGKISGFARDYFIAQGFTAASCIFEAKSFYRYVCCSCEEGEIRFRACFDQPPFTSVLTVLFVRLATLARSLDCVTWAQLPSVHAVTLASCNRLNARFTGSPSHEYTVTEPGPSASDAPLDLPREVCPLLPMSGVCFQPLKDVDTVVGLVLCVRYSFRVFSLGRRRTTPRIIMRRSTCMFAWSMPKYPDPTMRTCCQTSHDAGVEVHPAWTECSEEGVWST